MRQDCRSERRRSSLLHHRCSNPCRCPSPAQGRRSNVVELNGGKIDRKIGGWALAHGTLICKSSATKVEQEPSSTPPKQGLQQFPAGHVDVGHVGEVQLNRNGPWLAGLFHFSEPRLEIAPSSLTLARFASMARVILSIPETPGWSIPGSKATNVPSPVTAGGIRANSNRIDVSENVGGRGLNYEGCAALSGTPKCREQVTKFGGHGGIRPAS